MARVRARSRRADIFVYVGGWGSVRGQRPRPLERVVSADDSTAIVDATSRALSVH